MSTARSGRTNRASSATCACVGLALILHLGMVIGCSTIPTAEDRYRASLDTYSRTIPTIVRDEARAETLQEIGRDLFQDLRESAETLRGLTERIAALNRAYDTTRDELESALAELDRERDRLIDHILDARAAAVAVTTEDEWAAIVSRELSLLSVMQDDLDHRQNP